MATSTEIQPATGEGDAALPALRQLSASTLEHVMLHGDLAKLEPAQRLEWYAARCQAAGLDPRAQPFLYLTLNGKLVLYAGKACAEQLTGIHRLAVVVLSRDLDEKAGIYQVAARAIWPDGRQVDDVGAVPIAGLKGEALSNAIMKATTKAKRRAVLSACGLGMLPDESEVDSIEGARRITPEAAHAQQAIGGPPPQNSSGFGRGQYASPEQVKTYKAARDGFIGAANARWADRWQDPKTGAMPDGAKDVLNPWQVDGHLLKWAVEEERLDPGIVPEESKSRQAAMYVAIVFARGGEDRKALGREMNRYLGQQVERATEAIYRKHPELRPAEEESQEPPADDWAGDEAANAAEDIESTEAGARG